MRPLISCRLPRAKAVVAVLLATGLYFAARTPPTSADERRDLAARFGFEASPLPSPKDGTPSRDVRRVHPSLKHIDGWISAVGAAVLFADLDGDGLPNDVAHVDTRTDRVLVCCAPGAATRYAPFTLTPEPLHYDCETMAPMGCLAGDFNEDGLTDLLVYYWGRSPVLFLQRPGRGNSYERLSAASFSLVELVEPHQVWNTNAVTQADLDGDGHLDLIVCNYFPDGARVLDVNASGRLAMQDSMSRACNGGRKHLLRWEGSKQSGSGSFRFCEQTGVLDEDVACGWTLAVGAIDLDGDQLSELYFANDFGCDRLLHNRSEPGTFRFELLRGERGFATPRSKVLGRDSFKGMGVDFGDINGDGWPDIYVSNIAAPFALLESHFLFLSTGEVGRMRAGVAPYRDASEDLGLSRSGWGWDVRLADFDNDGALEAVQATGFRKATTNRWPELQELATSNDSLLKNPRYWPRFGPADDLSGQDRNPFFVRASNGRYSDIAPELGLFPPMTSRGIAVADIDLRIRAADQPTGGTRTWSGRPALSVASRPAVGAAAVVHLPDGRRLTAQVDGGSGHSGKRSPELHFGLGAVESGITLRVELCWRNRRGCLRSEVLALTPGWHTVLLSDEAEEDRP